MICEDKYGDGWHGGYIEVDGKKWCEDFTTGHAQDQSIVLSGNAGTYLFLRSTLLRYLKIKFKIQLIDTIGAILF